MNIGDIVKNGLFFAGAGLSLLAPNHSLGGEYGVESSTPKVPSGTFRTNFEIIMLLHNGGYGELTNDESDRITSLLKESEMRLRNKNEKTDISDQIYNWTSQDASPISNDNFIITEEGYNWLDQQGIPKAYANCLDPRFYGYLVNLRGEESDTTIKKEFVLFELEQIRVLYTANADPDVINAYPDRFNVMEIAFMQRPELLLERAYGVDSTRKGKPVSHDASKKFDEKWDGYDLALFQNANPPITHQTANQYASLIKKAMEEKITLKLDALDIITLEEKGIFYATVEQKVLSKGFDNKTFINDLLTQ